MSSQTFTLPADDGTSDRGPSGQLKGVVQVSNRPGPRPTVVVCHGFKGFLDWGFFPPLADLLAERAFTVVRFNFSGSGVQPGEDRVSDLEAFRRATFSRERDETLRVLDALGDEIAPGLVDDDHIGLLGHSRGGGAALLAAAHPSWRTRLEALVTWASVATFDRFDKKAKAHWRSAGSLEVVNARTGQTLALGEELLDDLESNRAALDLPAAAGRRQAPWLIIHGENDETVPASEARTLHQAAAAPAELMLVPGGSHTFGAQHPFAGPTAELVQVMNATQRWLRRHLCAQ